MKRRLTALLLLFAIFITLLPEKAALASPMYVENIGNVNITYDDAGKKLYDIYIENGALKVRGKYFSQSSATLSYHTEWLYFTTEYTDGNPTGATKYYSVNVHNHSTQPADVPGYVYDTYTIGSEELSKALIHLFGPDALKTGEQQLYISEGYVLKRWNSAKAEWECDSSPVYSTLEGIQGAAEWSYTTSKNFINYFDIPITLNLTSYTLTVKVNDTKGGIARQEKGTYYAGDTGTVEAVANDGYHFTGWTVDEGGPLADADISAATMTFTMPSTNVTLTANFEKEPEAIVTRPPVNTPVPEPTRKPGATATPTPTPAPTATPIPTPAPPYLPEESSEIYQQHIRYYTTDAGYTMQEIYNRNGYLAGINSVEENGSIKSCSYTQLDTQYLIGTDDAGNTWYFKASGTNATYVHPKVYKGNDVNSAAVRNITELTFPSTVTCGGTTYTVTSIGGGTNRYSTRDYISSNDSINNIYINGSFEPAAGEYSHLKYYTNSSSTYYHSQEYGNIIRYAYGVIGTGYITSTGYRHFYWDDSGEVRYDNQDYQNDYYVHNTTLMYLTIPDTVTAIADYAFYGCQALKKISGGDKVTSIGKYAFAGADHLLPKLCENGPQYSFRYYYYNGSYSFSTPTAVMTAWKKSIALSDYMELASFPALERIWDSAFIWRANLFDVTLPEGLTEIRQNAFAGCKLDRITIPGKTTVIQKGTDYSDKDGNRYTTGGGSTLGTKGNRETMIVTVPESKAMSYGLLYREYYILRCGYELTYQNNFAPEETYTSVSTLQELYETAVQTVDVGTDAIVFIDDDGDLFAYLPNTDAIATQIAKGTKFAEIKKMKAKHWNGSAYVSCYWYFAIGINGEVWSCTPYAPKIWTNLSMPAGSHSYQWSGCGEQVWLYYLNADGQICCVRVGEDSSHKKIKVLEHEKILHDYPNGAGAGYRFDSIVIENEGEPYPGATQSVYYQGTTYNYGCPPQIVAHASTDSPYHPCELVRYPAFPRNNDSSIAGCYMPPSVVATNVGDALWLYPGDTPVSVLMPQRKDETFLVGYEFREPLYANMFSRAGYRFLFWNTKADGSGVSYSPGEELLLTAPLTVYAQWEKAKRIIRYAPNGGTGVMEDDVYEFSVTRAVLKKNAYTRKGYEFTGWNTKADGSGIFYTDMETIALSEDTTVLYAQWEPFPYTVKVAADDIRVTPVTITDTFTLPYDEEMTVPVALANKSYTVGYDLNRRSTMSTIPYWKTATPLTALYTKASLTFLGWQLYEETSEGYTYVGFYSPGDKFKNVAEKKENALVLFPYWGGESSYVKLPAAGCDGYHFIGWTTDQNETEGEKVIHAEEGSGAQYKPTGNQTLYGYYEPGEYEVELIVGIEDADPGEIMQEQTSVTMTFDQTVPDVTVPESDRYVFLGYFTKPDGEGEQYYDENGYGLRTWRIHDGSVTALYAHMIFEVEVTLDGRGATKQEQTSVLMTYEEAGPDVIPPEKTGYTFLGYFTEIRGGGTQYFDENGKGTNIWLETDVDILYAGWRQNPVELPEKGEKHDPEVLPETERMIEAFIGGSVQIYADDYNAATGATDDIRPYRVSDCYSGTTLLAEGAIPSNECVAMRARTGSWMFFGALSRRSGVTDVRTYVTIPYKICYEDVETEELITSEKKTATVAIMVPKAWSYWELKEGGLYYPASVTVSNNALKNRKKTLSVEWEGYEDKKPSYTYISHEEHILWDKYDSDGVPGLTLTAPEEYLIVSAIPGEEPDITEYLTIVAENLAWADETEFTVRNDLVQVDDEVVLSDTEREKDGETPADDLAERLRKAIPFTAYEQTYESGIELAEESKNRTYCSEAVYIYEAAAGVVGSKEAKTKEVKVNSINIHTPVVCDASLEAAHENKYQCEEIPEDNTVLVLSETGIHSDFTVQISNTGYHSGKKGYGVKSYTGYLAQKEGKAQNEVCFPFAVWVDIGNDKDGKNDVLLKEGTWYTLGTEKQRFYVPVWIAEGQYKIQMRSVAVNGEGDEDKTEEGRNTRKENYVATAEKSVYVTGRLYDFVAYDIGGTAAWEEIKGRDIFYSVGVKTESLKTLWNTLPLRSGVHPDYKNVGGLPTGGSFSFRLKSIGSFYGKDAELTIIPELVLLTKEGRKTVDVYFEKETAQGVFLKKWDEEYGFSLLAKQNTEKTPTCLSYLPKTEEGEKTAEQYGERIENAVRYWYGTFTLPDTLFVAERGSDVLEYQKRYGLSFTEDFWIRGESLMLQFKIRLENKEGEVLYYGKLPEGIKNDIWCQEAGPRIRTDTRGTEYYIEGGDIAVIYFGESVAGDYVIHGLY